eukprot:gene4926-891_t
MDVTAVPLRRAASPLLDFSRPIEQWVQAERAAAPRPPASAAGLLSTSTPSPISRAPPAGSLHAQLDKVEGMVQSLAAYFLGDGPSGTSTIAGQLDKVLQPLQCWQNKMGARTLGGVALQPPPQPVAKSAIPPTAGSPTAPVRSETEPAP